MTGPKSDPPIPILTISEILCPVYPFQLSSGKGSDKARLNVKFGNSFSIILLDIDNFKKFNDTYGHTEGDQLLADVGKILSNEVRGLDLVARFGGEEFLILLPETELATTCKVAERIRKSVEAKTSITLSLGVTSCSSGTYTIENFIKKADDAMYQAKQKGKNRVEVSV